MTEWRNLLEIGVPGKRVYHELRVGNDLAPLLADALDLEVFIRGQKADHELLDKVGRGAQAEYGVGQLQRHVRGLRQLRGVHALELVVVGGGVHEDEGARIVEPVRQALLGAAVHVALARDHYARKKGLNSVFGQINNWQVYFTTGAI